MGSELIVYFHMTFGTDLRPVPGSDPGFAGAKLNL